MLNTAHDKSIEFDTITLFDTSSKEDIIKALVSSTQLRKFIYEEMTKIVPSNVYISPLFFNHENDFLFIKVALDESKFKDELNKTLESIDSAVSLLDDQLTKITDNSAEGTKTKMDLEKTKKQFTCFKTYLLTIESKEVKYSDIRAQTDIIERLSKKSSRFEDRFKKLVTTETLKRHSEVSWNFLSLAKIKRASNRTFWASTLKQTAQNHLANVTARYALLTNEFMLMYNLYSISCEKDEKCDINGKMRSKHFYLKEKFDEFKQEIQKNITAQAQIEDGEDVKEQEEFEEALRMAIKQDEVRKNGLIKRFGTNAGKAVLALVLLPSTVTAWILSEIGSASAKLGMGLTTGFVKTRRKIWKLVSSMKTTLNSEMLSRMKEMMENSKNVMREKKKLTLKRLMIKKGGKSHNNRKHIFKNKTEKNIGRKTMRVNYI
jgi:hypothetical protein